MNEIQEVEMDHVGNRILGTVAKSFVLAALTVVAVGCGRGAEPRPSTGATPTAVEPAAVETAAPAPADPSPAAGGTRTFQIAAGESQASYTVEEEFFSGAVSRLGKQLGFFTTVGATNEIDGQITLNLSGGKPEVVGGEFAVDISSLTSDDRRRDQRIREQFLQSGIYPEARFTVTGVEHLPDNYQPGQQASFRLLGDMTIREVTQPVAFDVTAVLDGDTLTGTASTELLMTDFGFDPPEIAGMMKSENNVAVTVDFTARAS
jgi:polyisoprenoid-binding protein YceI